MRRRGEEEVRASDLGPSENRLFALPWCHAPSSLSNPPVRLFVGWFLFHFLHARALTSEIELSQSGPKACPFHLETFRCLFLHGFSPTCKWKQNQTRRNCWCGNLPIKKFLIIAYTFIRDFLIYRKLTADCVAAVYRW